ncbi:hypothetical protein [Streptomyces longhuiensis]|uniref:hypothetical protein n=1 Tax=Streptomyces longhuiensis TaxID=2880933 RepID=UPI001D0B183A|nr:hypothetical protein [Streptomyces longhuiensis]UDM05597.1 hypothetical protein LGI35_45975 [Streptomyces longhuiensis]
MTVTDVWVELHSDALGVRMVRADTIEQVWWDVKQPEFLTIALHGGQEARQDVRAGFPTDDIEEDEAADLCTTLVERIAEAADNGGPRMVWMARDEDSTGVFWRRGPLIDRSAR